MGVLGTALGAFGASGVFEDFGGFGIVADFNVVLRDLVVFDAFRAVGVLVLLFLDTFGLLFLDAFGALGQGGSANCWSGSVGPFSFVERWRLFKVRSSVWEGRPEEGDLALAALSLFARLASILTAPLSLEGSLGVVGRSADCWFSLGTEAQIDARWAFVLLASSICSCCLCLFLSGSARVSFMNAINAE